ncbi:Uncharacterized membrane protein YgcG, contains a TPM-fold domain [Hymenobacter daecheongensis DSM 21074]|uniref:Uncharacterized membrane protein YgcG, contains a TPM-fold domain n=1 Tax=Hymenobacter daecheongensis DSM 21074 TaxID=1121955 RepID=A0A1M6AQY4_9BACT|nr:TPM domain-containing protein [Hymenobacter daecheongensis]SHI38934.1 Uncharacterized membrane protein YgcG, contains a TPM-fold domain [Hymenobacter daecheongensis DSM 21074]
MPRFLFFALFSLLVGLSCPANAQTGSLPPRPVPFQFINDQAKLLSAEEAGSLEKGLRRYASSTGTQVVVLTVPTLGGRPVADYARALGQSWGVGQRGKDNGLVILVAAQEHEVAIQTGRGLREAITPELTSRVINEKMTPGFRQGRYFAGLRAGLNTLLLAANPDSKPLRKTAATAAAPLPAAGPEAAASAAEQSPEPPAVAAAPEPASEPFSPSAAVPPASEPASPGLGLGAMALGALLVGGVVWLLVRLFRRRAAAPVAPAPDFRSGPASAPGQPTGPAGSYGRGSAGPAGPDFLPNRVGGAGMGSGMGGILMTGAAAAAGAYLGNRMAHGQDAPDTTPLPHPDNPAANLGTGAAGAAGAAGGGGFSALNTEPDATQETEPDYFSEEAAPNDSDPDYFSSDDSGSYDDSASDDTGGGGFDDDSNNSGSW